jgi:hypothetical protein
MHKSVMLTISIYLLLSACIPIPIEEITTKQVEESATQKQPSESIVISSITPGIRLPTETQTTNELTPTPLLPTRTITPHPELISPNTTMVVDEAMRNQPKILIDRNSVSLFDQIPEEYIEKASQISWLNRVASVGGNVSFGLDCLQNYFPDRDDPHRRPFACDRDLPPSEEVYSSRYDRSNWVFEFHSPAPNPNPGWYNKVNFFIERIDALTSEEDFQIVSFDVAYSEDPSINEHFFTNDDPHDPFPSVIDLANLRDRHPERTFVWWTLALARMSEPYTMEFNQSMREYASANNLILIDIADIESHAPDGTPCTGIDRDGNPTDIPAICPDYTNERFAGHLNSLGQTRMAKAVWVLMAQVAGWEPPNLVP